MSLVLAVEPDRRQAAHLTHVVRQRVGAELILADTTELALASIGNRVPDLILVPALLSPQDDAALAAALRVIATAAHVQMLTTPLFATAKPASRARGVLAAFRRSKAVAAATDGCDPAEFAEQISSYLQAAAEERATAQYVERSVPTPAPIVETSDRYVPLDPSRLYRDEPQSHGHVETPAVTEAFSEPVAAMPEPDSFAGVGEPVAEIVEPIAEIVEPAFAIESAPPADVAAPIHEAAQAISDTPEIETIAEPAAMSPELVAETAEPTLEATEPIFETAEPTFEMAEPTFEMAEPTLGTAEPVLEAAVPTLRTAEPTFEMAEPTLETIEPILEASEPTFETIEPTFEMTESTLETVEPVLEASESTFETIEPTFEMTESTLETVEPVLEASEPTFETTEPVFETPEPVVAATESAETRRIGFVVHEIARSEEAAESVEIVAASVDVTPIVEASSEADGLAALAEPTDDETFQLLEIVDEDEQDADGAIDLSAEFAAFDHVHQSLDADDVEGTAIDDDAFEILETPEIVEAVEPATSPVHAIQADALREFAATVEAMTARESTVAGVTEAEPAQAFEFEDLFPPRQPVEPSPLGAWCSWTPLEGMAAEATDVPVPAHVLERAVERAPEQPEWVQLVESLRIDVERRRAEQPDAAPVPVRKAPTRPVQDEWGLFDPAQCGFAALLSKLDEITEANESRPRHPA